MAAHLSPDMLRVVAARLREDGGSNVYAGTAMSLALADLLDSEAAQTDRAPIGDVLRIAAVVLTSEPWLLDEQVAA